MWEMKCKRPNGLCNGRETGCGTRSAHGSRVGRTALLRYAVPGARLTVPAGAGGQDQHAHRGQSDGRRLRHSTLATAHIADDIQGRFLIRSQRYIYAGSAKCVLNLW